ncbi:methyl-accepting chemotaxis protein [Falsibacillus albus]|uniref:Methyl-accepting chemotaxis protein n=1 Tax=Falsibacillus albus TaxID=2478915 RepID=A0A3L7K007_9BACI|nr:methyl-accepting chemotaxis protein [Falsibacillus albus]RLQ93982.1 methyl-accepting chemotaxis protein [Falsibacillus albus]
MFRSIKTKLIITITTLFIFSFVIMISIAGWQINTKTEDNVIIQANGIVQVLNNSTETFLNEYQRSVEQIASSPTIQDYSKGMLAEKRNKDALSSLHNQIDDFLTKYVKTYDDVSSIYLASPTKELQIVPHVDLPKDFDPTSRPWYQDALKSPGTVTWSEPYMDQATKEYVITASVAVMDGEQVLGVVGSDIKLSDLTSKMKKLDVGYDGYPFMMTNKGTAIVHPTEQGKDLSKQPFIKNMLKSNKKTGTIEYKLDGEGKILVYNTVPSTSWKIGASYKKKNLLELAADVQKMLIIMGIIIVILAIFILTFISMRITKPIEILKNQLNLVAKGDLTGEVPVTSKDEMGELSKNFNQMIHSMREMIALLTRSVSGVRESSEELSAVSEETNASSEQIAFAVNEIASGASKSAQDAESASLKSGELSDQINSIHSKATTLAAIAQQAETANKKGSEQIHQLNDAYDRSQEFMESMEQVITDLGQKVEKIGVVMETITDVSSQTNLLALNASIEAARAGEHGKGFAVVAEEVRKLAEQSFEATNDVQHTIADIQEGSRKAVESMLQTKEIAKHQTEAVKLTDQTFEQLASFIKKMEQSILKVYADVEDVTKSKEEVVEVIQNMAALAEQTAAACQEVSASTDEQLRAIQTVSESAEQLTSLSQELQGVVKKFEI